MLQTYSIDRRQFLTQSALWLGGLSVAELCFAGAPAEKPLPERLAPDRIDGPPVVSARAWAVAEGRTGRFLWGGNDTAELNMASTTKIMTAHIVVRLAVDQPKVLDEEMTISAQAAKTGGSSAQIRTGDRLTVRNMLYGLLLPSGNDAATALAEHFGARVRDPKSTAAPLDAFLAEMNRTAKTLRLAQTRYFDPHGLGRNHTSARDLTTLAYQAMLHPVFCDYIRTRRHACDIMDAKGARRTVTWNNTNKLLDIEGYDGVKTGTTTAAGSCLVASGRRGKDHLFVVVLGCTSNDSRYIDARNLFRWAWRDRGHKAE